MLIELTWLNKFEVKTSSPHALPDLLENCGAVEMPSRHLQCSLQLLTFSSVPNLIILTLAHTSFKLC